MVLIPSSSGQGVQDREGPSYHHSHVLIPSSSGQGVQAIAERAAKERDES